MNWFILRHHSNKWAKILNENQFLCIVSWTSQNFLIPDNSGIIFLSDIRPVTRRNFPWRQNIVFNFEPIFNRPPQFSKFNRTVFKIIIEVLILLSFLFFGILPFEATAMIGFVPWFKTAIEVWVVPFLSKTRVWASLGSPSWTS